MKHSLSTLLALLLATALLAAQDAKPASTPIAPSPGSSGQTARAATTDEPSIVKGAELKTEWSNARNPFRFEANETPSYAPERVEQMQVIGFSKMPDENGILQTYAFITKTTEGARVQGNKLEKKITKDVYILRALPEKLDEQTVTTEEQIDESSISLGSEQLWFLGVVQTNSQTLAIFVPDTATYPIKEEELRPFEIQDSLKDLHVRVTKAGEKISTEVNTPRTFSRPKGKSTPVKADPKIPAHLDSTLATPTGAEPDRKRTNPGTPVKAVNDAPKGNGPNMPARLPGGRS